MAYVVTQTPVGPEPTNMVCPHCLDQVTSIVETEPTTKTHIIFILLCVVGCWPCAPFVYCADSCLAASHTCPKCHQYLGKYEG